eukprot:g978.t1
MSMGTSGRYLFLDHLPPFLGNQIATLAEFLWLGYQTERTVVLPLQWKALYGETVGQLQAYVGKWTLHDLAVQRSAHNKVAAPPHPLRVEWVERMDLSDEQKNGDTSSKPNTIVQLPLLDLTAGQLRDGPMRFAVGGDAKARGMFSSFFRGDPEFYRGSCAPAEPKTEGKEGRADVEYVIPEAKNPAKVQPVYGPRVEITTITEDDLALGDGENKSRGGSYDHTGSAPATRELLPHQFAEYPCIARDLSEHGKGGRVALSMRAQTTHTYYQYKRACFLELLKFHPAVSQQKFLVLRQTWHAFSGLWEPEDVGGGSAGGEKEQRKAQEDNVDKLNLRSDPEPVVGRQFLAAFFAFFYRNTLERMFVRPYVLAAQARKHRKAEIRARRAVARASRGKVPVKCGLVVNDDDTTLGWHNCKPQVEDVVVAQKKAASVLSEPVPATQPEPQRTVLDFVMEFFLTQKVFAVHLRSMTRLLHPDEILSEYQKFATLHQEFVLYLCTDNADSDGVAALAEFLRTNYNFEVITSADTRDWARAVQLESDAALLEATSILSNTSRDRYGAAPDFHLFFELFLVSISQLLLGSPWSSLFWLMRRLRDHVVAKKILLHRTIDEVTCDGRLRSGALRNADPWLVFCGRGGSDEEDGEVGELADHDTLHHVEDAVRPFYEQLGYRVSPSSSSSSAGNAQQQGHVGPLEDENGTEILVAVAERQKLSHVRWDEILDEGGSLQQTSGSFRTLNTLEMFGDVDAGSIFPTSFYVFDLWSWMRNLAGLLRWAHEAETNDLERVFGASSVAVGAGGKGSSSFSTSTSAPPSTSAQLVSGSDSDAKKKWPEFLPFRGWSEDSQEKSVANHVKKPSPHFDRRVRVVLKMREDSTADGKLLTLEKMREVGHRVLGSIARQLGVNVDSEATNYRDHLFGVEGNKAVDDVKPVESPEILVDEALPSPETLFGVGTTTAGRKNKLQLDFSLGELVVALWNQESFVRTEGDASFAWLLYLKYIALFVTEGNYTEKECRQEVGTFAHATWLFFWVYTREHEKVAAAADTAKSSSASSASAGSVEIRGTLYRLLRIWREPATRYLETVWRYLAAFRCQPQFLGPTGEFVDASRNVRGEKEFAAFANRVAAENWLWCGAGTGAGDEDGGRDGNEACADAYRIEDARSEAVDFASLGLEFDAERPANYHNFLKKVQQLVRWDGYAAWSYGWKN